MEHNSCFCREAQFSLYWEHSLVHTGAQIATSWKHKFAQKKVHRNLSTWDLVLKISTRGIQRWKRFEIWTHGLRDKTFWINGSMKKGKTPRLRQVAHMRRATCRNLGRWKVIFVTSTPQLVISRFQLVTLVVFFRKSYSYVKFLKKLLRTSSFRS